LRGRPGSDTLDIAVAAMKPRTQCAPLVFVILLVVLPALGQQKSAATSAAHGSVPLDATACRPVTPEQRKWADGDWTPFENYQIACPLRTRGGVVVLYVLSVNDYDIEKARPPEAPATKLPKALIVTPQGHSVGRLPFAFPFDAPVSLDVKFANWSHGFPQTVELYLEDPAVGGNRKLPRLEWDAKQGQYIETEVANGS
jgi:hypothetical protein